MDVKEFVLILVLMDDALVPAIMKQKEDISFVLILVLMDDALVPFVWLLHLTSLLSLNPCFNG